MAANCRHCGESSDVDAEANPDWLCKHCDHYQDTIACPVCHQPTRISLLPAEDVPVAHEAIPELEPEPEGDTPV